mgnify:CR=1 FL=1
MKGKVLIELEKVQIEVRKVPIEKKKLLIVKESIDKRKNTHRTGKSTDCFQKTTYNM